MMSIALMIIGGAIILWGIAVSVLIYRTRQDYIQAISDKYLGDFSDDDIIPDEITLRIFKNLIRRVILVFSAILFIEVAGFALLVVSQVI